MQSTSSCQRHTLDSNCRRRFEGVRQRCVVPERCTSRTADWQANHASPTLGPTKSSTGNLQPTSRRDSRNEQKFALTLSIARIGSESVIRLAVMIQSRLRGNNVDITSMTPSDHALFRTMDSLLIEPMLNEQQSSLKTPLTQEPDMRRTDTTLQVMLFHFQHTSDEILHPASFDVQQSTNSWTDAPGVFQFLNDNA